MLIMKSNKVASILCTALILFGFGKSQAKFENIKTYLNNYEVSKITVLKRHLGVKYGTIENGERSIEVKAFGKKFDLDLSVYFPKTDVSVTYLSNITNHTTSFLDLHILIYQGQVRHVKSSFVIGSFPKKNLFRGYIITDEVYCIEPNYENNSVIVYKFKDVISPGCTKQAEGNGFDCTKTKYFTPWKPTHLHKSLQYLPYSWHYDKYLKLFSESEANKTKNQDLEKNNLDWIDKINSTEENENTTVNDGKEQNCTSITHHQGKSQAINGTDDDDQDDDEDDDDEDDDDNTISKTDDFSIQHTGRMKKDSYSETNLLTNSSSQNTTNFNNTANSQKDVQDNIDIHINDSIDREENIDNFKFSQSLLSPNESSYLVSITSKPSIMNLTGNIDSFIKNTSFFESRETSNESSYATNSTLTDEEIETKEKRSVKSPLRKKLKEKPIHLECDVQFVFDRTIAQRFDNRDEDVIKDIFIQMALINKIFAKVDLRRKSHPFHLHLEVQDIVIYGDNIESPFKSGSNLEYFAKNRYQTDNFCLTIGLVNEHLKSKEFSEGYIPEGGGGACAKSGNVIIVSHGNSKTPAPMALYFSALMRGITRSIGANDANKTCTEGPFPNPMKMLRHYLLAKRITPEKKHSIFTECNLKEIEVSLNNARCLVRTHEPWCGNGIVDEGEECDCGPDYICDTLDMCCTPHHHWGGQNSVNRGCKLVKGAKCSSSQPCCHYCNVTKEKTICNYSPDPCAVGKCDGKSASCPTAASYSDGKICKRLQPEPLVCKNRKCGEGLCSGSNFKPCTCSKESGKECVYCCLKDGKCQAAGSGLQLLKGKDYPVVDGTGCHGGKCSKGNCSVKHQKLDVERFPASVDGAIVNLMTSSLIFLLMTLHFLRRYFI